MKKSCIDQILELVQRYGLAERNRQIAAMVAAFESGSLTEDLARAWLPSVRALAQEQIEHPNYLPPPPDAEQLSQDGPFDIEIGTLTEGDHARVGLPLWRGAGHFLVAGASGRGKTVTVKRICLRIIKSAQATRRRVSIICFDTKGGDFADLPGSGGDWRHLSVHDGLRLGFNGPADMPAQVWITEVICPIIAARCGLKFSATTLARLMTWLYRVLNADQPKPALWPNVHLLLEVARAGPPTLFAAKEQYHESLCQALEGLDQASGEFLQTFHGIDIEESIRQGHSLVFDMANLGPVLRTVMVDLIISQVLRGRIHRYQKVDTTDVAFVLDEADEFISRPSVEAYAPDLAPIERLLKQGREFGCAAVIGATMLGQASRFVLSNIMHHLILGQQDPLALEEAAQTLLLPLKARPMLSKLRKGECIVRSSEGWSDPMIVQIDHAPPFRGGRPERFDTHPYIPAKRYDELPQVAAALKVLREQRQVADFAKGRQGKAKPSISENARKLLDLASLYPAVPVQRLWEKTKKPAGATRSKVRRELEDKRLADFAEARIGKETWLLMELTEEGYRAINKRPVKLPGRGELVHRTFAHWLAQVGNQRGHHAVLEWPVPAASHPVDCAWGAAGDRWHCYEVVEGALENVASHVRHCLVESTVVADVTIVAGKASTLNKLRKDLQADSSIAPLLDRVKFELIEIYARELGL